MTEDNFGFRPDKTINKKNKEKKDKKEKISKEVRKYLQKAQQAEKQADIEQMSAEDTMQYYYMKTIVEVLKEDYDILLKGNQ